MQSITVDNTNRLVFVDDDLLSLMLDNRWHITPDGYVRSNLYHGIYGERFLHRIIMRPQIGFEVHHKNSNPLDNTRNNLAIVTRATNAVLRGNFINNTSGYKGVTFHNGKYQTSIRVKGRLIYLGRFETAEQAYQRYLSARMEHFGV